MHAPSARVFDEISTDPTAELPYEEHRSHFETVPNRVLASSNDHVVRLYDAERWGSPILQVSMDWPANWVDQFVLANAKIVSR